MRSTKAPAHQNSRSTVSFSGVEDKHWWCPRLLVHNCSAFGTELKRSVRNSLASLTTRMRFSQECIICGKLKSHQLTVITHKFAYKSARIGIMDFSLIMISGNHCSRRMPEYLAVVAGSGFLIVQGPETTSYFL